MKNLITILDEQIFLRNRVFPTLIPDYGRNGCSSVTREIVLDPAHKVIGISSFPHIANNRPSILSSMASIKDYMYTRKIYCIYNFCIFC